MPALREVVPLALEIPSSGGTPSIGDLSEPSSSEARTGSASLWQSSNRSIEINPLQYLAWDSLLSKLPQISFFHGTAWARVLHDTYGHRPIYYCRFTDDKLAEVLPIMEVSSLL